MTQAQTELERVSLLAGPKQLLNPAAQFVTSRLQNIFLTS